ncbi:MAG: M23 family peptidase [Bacteroidetes bacterium QS_8_64_10]|jgi:murein DD-endopeptidase MepM/ murein hydrolase activator NlpD|nr:MAG: M23 family peptidase [Bacteroidetes bacterium QS_8_64_10]
MSDKKYYYYDHESCSFVEVEAQRTKTYGHIVAMLIGAVALAWVITWGLDYTIGTPQELALQAENQALQEQLSKAEKRMETFQERLSDLASSDKKLYRTLLGAAPLSDDVRRAGVGGTDPYQKFDRFSKNTAKLLQKTAGQIDRLQRQINVQNESYRELFRRTRERESWLKHMPALLPAEGPIVSGYGKRTHPLLGVKKMHTGIDIALDEGAPVSATGNGVVKRAKFLPNYGNFIEVEHRETNYSTLYAHLSKIGDNIEPGVKVKRGETIGLSGNSGRSTGPHLHYEVRNSEGHTLDPVRFFVPSMTPEKYQRLRKQANESTTSLD